MKKLTAAELKEMKNNMEIYVSEGYTITAQRPVIGQVYHNELENVDYCATEEDTDKVLLVGTVGELWFAPISRVLKQYSKEDGAELFESDITEKPIKIKRLTSYNAAIQLMEDTNVEIKAGNILHAKKFDYLVCSVSENENGFFADDKDGYWTINCDIFSHTNKKIEGKCGDNLYWSIDKDNTLIIGGNGKMYDYKIHCEVIERYYDGSYMADATITAPWFDNFEDIIKTIIIKDGVKNISRNAFTSLPNLTTVIISNSVKSIEYEAFARCKSLTNVTIEDGVEIIERSAFINCESLTNIIIPNSVRIIGDRAFEWCKSLTNIIIPNSVRIIGDGAFEWCKKLTNVIISDGVERIGDYAFRCCESLTNVIISDGIEIIEETVFTYCESLTNIIIPNSVRIIEDGAFKWCKNLTNVIRPNNVETFED